LENRALSSLNKEAKNVIGMQDPAKAGELIAGATLIRLYFGKGLNIEVIERNRTMRSKKITGNDTAGLRGNMLVMVDRLESPQAITRG
jgi:hypothetical protein